jgi:hypothetical protein
VIKSVCSAGQGNPELVCGGSAKETIMIKSDSVIQFPFNAWGEKETMRKVGIAFNFAQRSNLYWRLRRVNLIDELIPNVRRVIFEIVLRPFASSDLELKFRVYFGENDSWGFSLPPNYLQWIEDHQGQEGLHLDTREQTAKLLEITMRVLGEAAAKLDQEATEKENEGKDKSSSAKNLRRLAEKVVW